MSKKNFKRIAALMMAATMTVESAMTVFAADDSETPAAPTTGVSEGTGSYEGGEMKYPTLSVTLPTIPDGTYDYIADPNGLIAATQTAKYANSTFTGDKGLFFLTSTAEDGTKTYTEKSAAQTLTNENAQDIDVTVKLEQKTAGDAIVKYADSATFADTDKENKIYLAVTDDASTDAKVSALTATGAATVTKTVAGTPGNYTPGYNTTNGYGYTKKTGDGLTWGTCSFILTGAINKNATWGDGVNFPEIKVTWSYAEHVDATPANGSVDGGELWLTVDGSNGFSARPSSFKIDGTETTEYTYYDSGWISMTAPTSGSVVQFVVENVTYRFVLP